jgi:hypothetical protein
MAFSESRLGRTSGDDAASGEVTGAEETQKRPEHKQGEGGGVPGVKGHEGGPQQHMPEVSRFLAEPVAWSGALFDKESKGHIHVLGGCTGRRSSADPATRDGARSNAHSTPIDFK